MKSREGGIRRSDGWAQNGKGNVSRLKFTFAWLEIPLRMIIRSFNEFEE
jgi:hypothetical protein